MNWQPIETAPSNERVLLFFPWKRRIAVGCRRKNLYQSEPDWTSDDGEAMTLQFDTPTHWQPLPPAPSMSATQ